MSSDGFDNPTTAGSVLVIPEIQSDNYVPGVSGWRVGKDGTSEFGASGIRGTMTIPSGAGPTDNAVLIEGQPEPAISNTGAAIVWQYSQDGVTRRAVVSAIHTDPGQTYWEIRDSDMQVPPTDTNVLRFTRYDDDSKSIELFFYGVSIYRNADASLQNITLGNDFAGVTNNIQLLGNVTVSRKLGYEEASWSPVSSWALPGTSTGLCRTLGDTCTVYAEFVIPSAPAGWPASNIFNISGLPFASVRPISAQCYVDWGTRAYPAAVDGTRIYCNIVNPTGTLPGSSGTSRMRVSAQYYYTLP